jgi:hypothetical protein
VRFASTVERANDSVTIHRVTARALLKKHARNEPVDGDALDFWLKALEAPKKRKRS